MTSSARASRTFRGAAIALALTVFPLAGVAANPVSAKGGGEEGGVPMFLSSARPMLTSTVLGVVS